MKNPLALRLARITGAFLVYWTERPDSDHELLQKRYDCIIFEHYRPENHF